MSSGLRRAWRPVLGAAILLLAVISTDPAAIASRIAAANVGLVLLGVAGLTAMHVVPALGWRSLLSRMGGTRLPYAAALRIYYSAQAIGGVTPANLGGDLHRAAVVRGWGLGWSAAVAPLIVQRATSYLALSALSLVAVAVLAAATPATVPFVLGGLAFAGAVAGISWLLLAPPAALAGAHRRLVALVAGESPTEATASQRLGGATLVGLASGTAFHAGSIGFTWLLIAAVDPSVAGSTMLAAVALARLSLAVPLTPSGIGLQEGVLAIMAGSMGLGADGAVAGLLLARLALLSTTLVGVSLLAGGWRYRRPDAAQARVTPRA